MNDETIRNNAIYILNKYHATKKYDNLLCLRFLIKLGFAYRRGDKIIIDMSKAEEFPSFESITRVRKKLNEEGLCLSDEETQEKREKSRGEFKEKYSNKERSVDEMPNSQLMY